jgi:ubiquinone biosynthesis protein COQ4
MRTIISVMAAFGKRLVDVAQACAYFLILAVRPSRRSHYGQQFLYKTEGETFERAFASFERTRLGPTLLAERPDSVALLRTRDRLAAQPEGSLGRSYAEFMIGAGIDEDLYLAGAIEAGERFERDPRRRWFRTRVEAGHDLRHVLTDYGIDPLGETCLMAFRFGQTRHVGALVIATLGFVVLSARRQRGVAAAMREAYRRGRAALLLDLLPWEMLLGRPLAIVRREARLQPPRCYPANTSMPAPIATVAEARA